MPREAVTAHRTVRAARTFNRRLLLKSGLATGVLAMSGCQTTASRKQPQLNIAIWSDYLTDNFREDFARETGIEIITRSYGTNGELLSMVRGAAPGALDLVGPTVDRAPLWEHQRLLQPIDLERVDTSSLIPALLAQSLAHWTWNSDLYHLPMMWGTEAVAWRSDKWSPRQRGLSYGDLWLPEMKGKVQGRAHSLLLGMGLYLDGTGEVPSRRMMAAYSDPAEMERVWGAITEFAIGHRFWINQFWHDARGQSRGFTHAGCVIGQAWDGPMLRLRQTGAPVAYKAPQEGAIAWMDGLSIPVGAKNLDGVYLFLEYMYRAQVSGRLASSTGYNPVSADATAFMDSSDRDAYLDSLPGDALQRLWFWPPAPDWYQRKRAEFTKRFAEAVASEPAQS
jgi:spermidine/putrescine transport system substrate-binding protein